MSEKANPTASLKRQYVGIPTESRFLDGEPFDPYQGGVVVAEGKLITVADPSMVILSEADIPPSNGRQPISAQRVGDINISQAEESTTAKSGNETEVFLLTPDGEEYPDVTNSDGEYKEPFEECTPELYGCMIEVGQKESDDPHEVRTRWQEQSVHLADLALKAGVMIDPISVRGASPTTQADQSRHPYVTKIVGQMAERTGFITAKRFNNAGIQFHAEIIDTDAAIKAAEDYQAIAPILSAASLSGPFGDTILEGIHNNSSDKVEKQQQHLKRADIRPSDLRGEYLSWRYLSRRIGSDGGTWMRTAPKGVDAYLLDGHRRLQAKEISIIDRNQGNHSDVRIRLGLNTLEVANYDGFAGNEQKAAAFQLLTRNILVNMQKMHLNSQDPREVFPELFGEHSGQQALRQANRDNFAVARQGMNAEVHEQQTHKKINELLKLANYYDKEPLPEWAEREVRLSYQPNQLAVESSREWCKKNSTRLPSVRAYYETGIGVPSIYMIERAKALREDNPGLSRREIAKQVELDIAKTYMDRAETIYNSEVK